MPPTVVVTDHEFADLAPERAVIESAGFTLVDAQASTAEEVVRACAEADAIINQYQQLDAEVISQLHRCRIISRYGIGLNTIDVPAASAAGIAVANVPDGSLDDVSDHTIALMLALSRGVAAYDRSIRSGEWSYSAAGPLYRLRGRTLGLIGFGQIPRRVAEKAAPFGLRVIAYDPFASPDDARDLGVELVSLDELYRASDVVSVHVPLTEETRGLVGADAFALMRPTALLINTSRGPVVDEPSLLDALERGGIAGAGLDVFTVEPLASDHPLRRSERAVLTPHAAWYSEDSEVEIRTKTAQNVVLALQGAPVPYQVNAPAEGLAGAAR